MSDQTRWKAEKIIDAFKEAQNMSDDWSARRHVSDAIMSLQSEVDPQAKEFIYEADILLNQPGEIRDGEELRPFLDQIQ